MSRYCSSHCEWRHVDFSSCTLQTYPDNPFLLLWGPVSSLPNTSEVNIQYTATYVPVVLCAWYIVWRMYTSIVAHNTWLTVDFSFPIQLTTDLSDAFGVQIINTELTMSTDQASYTVYGEFGTKNIHEINVTEIDGFWEEAAAFLPSGIWERAKTIRKTDMKTCSSYTLQTLVNVAGLLPHWRSVQV